MHCRLHGLRETSGTDMPSKSKAQEKLMSAVAHGWHMPGGGGPPKAVAEEFHEADKAKGHGGHENKHLPLKVHASLKARALRDENG